MSCVCRCEQCRRVRLLGRDHERRGHAQRDPRAPDPGQIITFFLGAIATFAIIEAVATRGFTRALDDKEVTKVIALGGSLSLVSIASAVGVCAAVANVTPAGLAWLLGPFVASMTYLFVTAGEMTVARRIQEARNVQ